MLQVERKLLCNVKINITAWCTWRGKGDHNREGGGDGDDGEGKGGISKEMKNQGVTGGEKGEGKKEKRKRKNQKEAEKGKPNGEGDKEDG